MMLGRLRSSRRGVPFGVPCHCGAPLSVRSRKAGDRPVRRDVSCPIRRSWTNDPSRRGSQPGRDRLVIVLAGGIVVVRLGARSHHSELVLVGFHLSPAQVWSSPPTPSPATSATGCDHGSSPHPRHRSLGEREGGVHRALCTWAILQSVVGTSFLWSAGTHPTGCPHNHEPTTSETFERRCELSGVFTRRSLRRNAIRSGLLTGAFRPKFAQVQKKEERW